MGPIALMGPLGLPELLIILFIVVLIFGANRLPQLATQAEVRAEIAALNERIKKASFAVTWGPSVDVLPLDADEVIARWRADSA